MKKEAIICIITFIFIIIGNSITTNYTYESVRNTTSQLDELKEIISKDDVDFELAKNRINTIHEKWDVRYNALAFYIEHNELEKIETELTGLRSSIETKEYEEGLNELDRAVYLLKHIEEKNKLSWKNIF